MPHRVEGYRIVIGERWTLEDLYVFPHTFEQLYFLYYSLMLQVDESSVERIMYAYSKFPWQGGYSAVNFYNQLKYAVPKQARPTIQSIRYGSPGWIDLTLAPAVAKAVEFTVKAIANSITHANRAYNEICTGLQKRKLMRIKVKRQELQLKKEELEYVKSSLKSIAEILGLKNIEEMNRRTGSPYKTLKILLSTYRRVRDLASFQNKGKIEL